MSGIVELTDTLTELPGYAPWVLGLLPNRGQNVQVVDIAQIIMPAERQALIAPAAERIKYVILIDGGRFGLAADSLSQVLSLEPAEVRWRSRHSKRPWLAGTVVEHMCALLEIDRLCEQLAAGLEGLEAAAPDQQDGAAENP
jgi:purine-binding chemotaxis protein CheW